MSTTVTKRSVAPLEMSALVLLLLSTALAATVYLAILAPLAWLPGMVLLAVSTRWRPQDKLLGFFTYGIGGLVVPAILVFGPILKWVSTWRQVDCTGEMRCTAPSTFWLVVSFVVVTVIFLFQLWTAYRLWQVARRGTPTPTADDSPALTI